jgi:outer membrane protein assembly factor BamB
VTEEDRDPGQSQDGPDPVPVAAGPAGAGSAQEASAEVRHGQTLTLFGAVLLLGGVALLVAGFFYFEGTPLGPEGEGVDAPDPTGFTAPTWLWLLFWSAVIVLLLPLVLGNREEHRERRSVPRQWRFIAAAVAVAVIRVLLVDREYPIAEFWLLRPDPAPRPLGGFRDAAPMAGAAAVALGALTLLAAARRGERASGEQTPRRWGVRLLAAGCGALVVVLLATLAGAAILPRTQHEVQHTTHDATGAPAHPPGTVAEVAWSWEPEELNAQEVLPSAHGVLVRLGDGVLALDGETGEEQWRYRRPGIPALLRVSTDGGTVALAYRTWTSRGTDTELLTLDAATGRRLGEHPLPDAYPLHSFAEATASGPQYAYAMDRVRLTAQSHVTLWRDVEVGRPLIEGYSLDSGESVWSYPREASCAAPSNGGSADDKNRIEVADDLVLVSLHCEEEPESTGLVLALDAETGAERWRHEWESRPRERAARLHAPLDYPDAPWIDESYGWVGSASPYVVVQQAGEGGDPRHFGGFVLDIATGAEIAAYEAEAEDEEDRYSVLGVTGDAVLLAWQREDEDRPELERVPLSGEEPERFEDVDFRQDGTSADSGAPVAVLQDAVASIGAAEGLALHDGTVYNGFHVQVLDLEEDAEPRAIELDIELNRADAPSDMHLFPAPGALIAAPGGDERPWMVLGLS